MSDTISRQQVKSELYAIWAEHMSKSTYDAGFRDGLRRSLDVIIKAPAAECEAKHGD